jgi:cytochrome o ubiquinol oxidase operon protein cyoD
MSHGEEQRVAGLPLRRYLWNYGVCVLLTVSVFALVAWGTLDKSAIGWILSVAALIQILAQFRGFLDIRLKGQTREDLQLILFTTVLLVLMAGGTIWILSDLDERMHLTQVHSMPESL